MAFIRRRQVLTCMAVVIFFSTLIVLRITHRGRRFLGIKDYGKPEVTSIPVQEIKFVFNNENICNGAVETIVVIISDSKKYEARKALRETWAKNSERFRYVFLLGSSKNVSISKEAEKYRDIVISNLVDDYRNLSLKSLAMLKWTHNYCRTANYIIKVDDDMYIDIPSYSKELHMRRNEGMYFVCFVVGEGSTVSRDRTDKFYVDVDIWPQQTYPRYCSGTAYGFSRSLLPSLLLAAQKRQAVPIEDVYVTGILARDISAKHFNLSNINFTVKRVHLRDESSRLWCIIKGFLTAHQLPPYAIRQIWIDRSKHINCFFPHSGF